MSAETEKAVRRAAADLGYRPNVAARALRTGAARSIALIVPDVTNPFFGHVMRGAQAAAWTAGYAVALVDTANDPEWQLSSYEALRGGPVDGFLVFGIDPPPPRRGARGERIVLMEDEAPGHPSVRLDSAGGTDAVMAHLLGLGHRRIGRIAAPFDRHAFRDREERWRAALVEAGVDPDAMPHRRSEITFAAAPRGRPRAARRARPADRDLLRRRHPRRRRLPRRPRPAAAHPARRLRRRLRRPRLHPAAHAAADDRHGRRRRPRRAGRRGAARPHARRGGPARHDAAGDADGPRLDGRARGVRPPGRRSAARRSARRRCSASRAARRRGSARRRR